MTEEKERVEFEVGDKVIDINTNEKGRISRLCSSKDAVFVRWDKDSSQEMVETKNIKKEGK